MKEMIFAVKNYSNAATMEMHKEVLNFIHREDVEAICILHNLRGGGGYQLGKLLSLVI